MKETTVHKEFEKKLMKIWKVLKEVIDSLIKNRHPFKKNLIYAYMKTRAYK